MKRPSGLSRVLPTLFLVAFLVGCAHMEYAPGERVLFIHKELPAAARAVEAARQAGKDRECPEAFKEAERLKDEAYQTYWACRTNEAIAMANEAAGKARALCPARAAAPAPPAPTVSLSANPATIVRGQCTSLSWSSTNARSGSIDQGVGTVDPGGSRQVCPADTTRYTLTATGPGGSGTASTTVTVNPPPAAAAPPPPVAAPAPPRVVDRLTIRVNFDFDKAQIRKEDVAELQKALDFVKKYAGAKISLEGHTDSIGTEQYNQGLSERRAGAVRDYLVKQGAVDARKIQAVGYGETKPIASNSTPAGRFQNRRVEILILSE